MKIFWLGVPSNVIVLASSIESAAAAVVGSPSTAEAISAKEQAAQAKRRICHLPAGLGDDACDAATM
ncbi:hypothetical protein ACIQU4_27630 [Streptomyces sp. NPDC090741]|uniref:hypothetical protein n=1 Tax=Streptomyces sp. NPDC090741 TaxID=3365967 RepID=UPI0038121BA2